MAAIWESEVTRVIRAEIHIAEIAQHHRVFAKGAKLVVLMFARR
jgi:hypothetical protein